MRMHFFGASRTSRVRDRGDVPAKPRSDRVSRTVPLSRRLVFWFCAYLLVEGTIFCSLVVLRKTRGTEYRTVMSHLTDEQKEEMASFVASGGNGRFFRQDCLLGWIPADLNSAGMRDSREYDPVAADNVVRIAAYGDSFTFGDEVAVEDAWPNRLGMKTPELEVFNYGVRAYGPDQAYLRYQLYRRDYSPDIVFIGYLSGNLIRTVSVFRPFMYYHPSNYTKPRFVLADDGNLTLLPNPVATLADHQHFLANDAEVLKQLAEHDYHYQVACKSGAFDFLPSVRFAKLLRSSLDREVFHPIFHADGTYATESEAYPVTTRILDCFYREVLADGALPVVVILPEGTDQRRSREGKVRRYQELLDDLHEKGHAVIDVLEALIPLEDQYSVAELSAPRGHFNELANGIVAEYLYEELRARGMLDRQRLGQAVLAERLRLKVKEGSTVLYRLNGEGRDRGDPQAATGKSHERASGSRSA